MAEISNGLELSKGDKEGKFRVGPGVERRRSDVAVVGAKKWENRRKERR